MTPLVIAAPSSGCGKTTVTLAVLAALRRREVRIAPFKVGPDFIDPGHHASICGRESRNLDGWMCGETRVRETFARGCSGAEAAIIEGVMGLFDGASGDSDEGSTAEIARWLKARILLVVDARSQARSAAALVRGFCDFDSRLDFAGILFNRVGSPRHEELLRQAVASTEGLPPVLGCLPREEDLTIPERHLGLVTAGERLPEAAWVDGMADWAERYIDLGALLPRGQGFESDSPSVPYAGVAPRVRIAVARDEAFCFYYPENLELLEEAGAELVFFSPLRDESLPAGIRGIYLGGGYPELNSDRLARNARLLRELREAAEGGLPVYAECGGFMLLSESIDDRPMAGVFPARARMLPRRRALGYREVVLTEDTPMGRKGARARGHEFHYSEMEMPAGVARTYGLSRRGEEDLGVEGYRIGNVLGSYIHLHFASNPQLARNFVEFCRKRTEGG